MRTLSRNTKIRLSQIADLKEWHAQLIQDKHGPKVETGTVRRWSDGKLHEKTNNGWRVVPHNKEYELKEYNNPKARKNVKGKVTSRHIYNDFVDKLFNGDYKNAPATVHLPKLNKGLLKTLGLKENTQFIFTARYPHISPTRKASEGQALTKEEYKRIPEVIQNTKNAYIDKQKKNFFIVFSDKTNPEMINKLVFNKATNGNYLVTLGKVNKKDELASRENLLVSGRS